MAHPESSNEGPHEPPGGVSQSGPARQREIFFAGLAGRRPPIPSTPQALERAAERAMSPQAWAYVSGGAGAGHTMRANREVTALQPSGSRPEAGIITFRHQLTNQRGEVVCSCLRTALIKRRSAPENS